MNDAIARKFFLDGDMENAAALATVPADNGPRRRVVDARELDQGGGGALLATVLVFASAVAAVVVGLTVL